MTNLNKYKTNLLHGTATYPIYSHLQLYIYFLPDIVTFLMLPTSCLLTLFSNHSICMCYHQNHKASRKKKSIWECPIHCLSHSALPFSSVNVGVLWNLEYSCHGKSWMLVLVCNRKESRELFPSEIYLLFEYAYAWHHHAYPHMGLTCHWCWTARTGDVLGNIKVLMEKLQRKIYIIYISLHKMALHSESQRTSHCKIAMLTVNEWKFQPKSNTLVLLYIVWMYTVSALCLLKKQITGTVTGFTLPGKCQKQMHANTLKMYLRLYGIELSEIWWKARQHNHFNLLFYQ